jgi:carboxymethylenebutenolidase
MRQEIIDLYDEYTHRGLDRRVFMERLVALAGSSAAATAALAALKPNYAQAAIVAPDDPRLAARMVTIGFSGREVKAYKARLADMNQPKPVVVVIHENRGLNAHIQDVARRFALEGFLAVAPDFLSSMGGSPANEDQAREMIGKLAPDQVVSELSAIVAAMATDSDSNGKVGIVGFCWGGGIVNQAVVRNPDIDAGVVYYGRTPPLDLVPNIQAPLLLNYAGQDQNVNATVPDYEAALKQSNKTYTLHMYEGAQHAFNNDTSEARYNKEAADLAWSRTVAFFRRHLGSAA